ncbi:MAG: YqjF family protein [Polyangiaceae bacterium]
MTTTVSVDASRPGARPFLTARWTNLFLSNYAVPHDLLLSRLPPGLALDTRDGQAFVSLVCFDFLDTRVLGVPWPCYRNFPENNLRFYVRRGDERGVVFVREFVPQRLIAWMARTLYNERYLAADMTSAVTEQATTITVEHAIAVGGRTHTVRVVGEKPTYVPEPTAIETFFKEHQWGFGVSRGGETLRYRVWHPVWSVYPVREAHIDLDWAAVYGPEWSILQSVDPVSTVLAAGSEIAVYPQAAP